MDGAIPILGHEPPKLQLQIRAVQELCEAYPPAIIEGLLRQTEILLMGGQAKRWKSWARLDMLYCVANGFRWLRFPCCQAKVIHFDLELLEADLRHRFELIHQSYAEEGLKGSFENLKIVPLRGQPFSLSALDEVPGALSETFRLFSLDPIYRLLGGKNESDQGVVTELLNHFLTLGYSLGAAIALLQHFAKGDQALKESQDRFSGSGVWSRFPDSLMTFTDLEDENCFSCEFTVRSFEPIEPFAVRWEFPRFRIASEVDTENLKLRTGRPKKSSVDQLCAIISASETISYSDFWRRAAKVLSISQKTFDRRLKEAKERKAVYLSPLNNEYALTAEYLQRNGDFPLPT